MFEVIGAIVLVVFVWWFSTGAILLLGRLHKKTYPWSMAAMTLVMIGALCALIVSSKHVSTGSVIVSFCAAIAIWAWLEMTFLFGYITGPSRRECPAGLDGWSRFGHAFATLRHHEIALFAALILVALVTWSAPNIYGVCAFAILWLMRLAAKFNLFWGVPYFDHQILPKHLAYLASYFRKGPITAFYVFTVSLATLVAGWLILEIRAAPDHGTAHVVGLTILASLLGLALLEHIFMALPMRETALWSWALIDEQATRLYVARAAHHRVGTLHDGLFKEVGIRRSGGSTDDEL